MKSKKIDIFIENVCNQISSKEVAKDISIEMKNHIISMVKAFIKEGLSEEKAIEKSLYNMGDPRQIGYGINISYKDKRDVLDTLVIVSIFIGLIIGVVSTFSNILDLAHKLIIGLTVICGIFSVIGIIKARRLIRKTGEEPLIMIKKVDISSSMDKLMFSMLMIPIILGLFSLIIMIVDKGVPSDVQGMIYAYYVYIGILLIYHSKTRPSVIYPSGIATFLEFLPWEEVSSHIIVKSHTNEGIIHELNLRRNRSLRSLMIKIPEKQLKAVFQILREKSL